MPIMKRLTLGGVNYDTVGEASVTQVQTSGTKIATVTIDGTATDLYAPEGGSVTMTEEEVDAAVRAAWPVYTITNNASSYATVDMTSAGEYETVTVTVTSVDATHVVRAYFGTYGTTLGSWNSVGTHTFVMPAADVTIAYEFAGGGND